MPLYKATVEIMIDTGDDHPDPEELRSLVEEQLDTQNLDLETEDGDRFEAEVEFNAIGDLQLVS